MKALALILLLLATACAKENAAPLPAAGVREIRVGRVPDLPTPCSRGLVLFNFEDRSVSVIDLPAGEETARIALPTQAWLTGLTVDDSSDRAFVVTNDGEVFEIDLQGLEMRRVFKDERLYFSAAAWDTPRRRLLLSVGETGRQRSEVRKQESIQALVEGRLVKLVSPPVGPQVMHARGDRLWCAGLSGSTIGEAVRMGGVGVVDLATDTLLRHELLPVGQVADLALGPRGTLWAAEDGGGRLLGFSPNLDESVVRNLFDFWGDERYELPEQVEVDTTRVLVMLTGSERIVEFERRGDLLSDHPVREYDLEDTGPTGMCLLPGGRIAVTTTEGNAVLLLSRSEAGPFSGFARD